MKESPFWQQLVLKGTKNIKTYLIAQMKLLVIVFFALAASFIVLDVNLAVLLALGIAILDLLPVIGSGLVFLPWIIFEWFWGDNTLAWQLALVYVIVIILKQIGELLLVGHDLQLPFWIPLMVTLICSLLFNVFGFLVAAVIIPFISAFWQLYHFKNRDEKSST